MLALVLVALAPLVPGATLQLPLGWTHGWSQPVPLGTGDRLLGYQSAVLDSGVVVIVVGNAEGDLSRLSLSSYDMQGASAMQLGSIEVHGLREYALTAIGDSVFLAVLRRESDSFAAPWRFEMWSLLVGHESGPVRMMEFARTGVASDITITAIDTNRLVWAWSGSSVGLRNINVLAHDTSGDTVAEFVLDHPETADRYPSLEAEPSGNIYLTYYRDNAMFAEVVYSGLTLSDGTSPEVVSLGRASPETPRPLLRAFGAGTAMIYWAQPFRAPGRGQGAAIYMGELTHGGQWLKELEPIIQMSGTVSQLSVEGTDPVSMTWLTDRGGSMQIEHAELSGAGEILDTGPVTRGSENRFLPKLHVTSLGTLVLYAQYTQTSLILQGVDDVRPAKAPLSYWMGLDPRAPLGDAAFRYITLLGSALSLASLAGLSLLFAVLAVLAVSRFFAGEDPLSQIPAATMLLIFLTLLRQVGGLLYYGVVHVPGPAGFFVLAGSAVFALGATRLMRRHVHGVLSLSLCGFLFMVADFFASIYVGGLLP
ncbi:MAG TPA: hypothetical protein VK905_00730 [Bacillota bacterium]|nr:hypothetical protein [Bacillota bacterium]